MTLFKMVWQIFKVLFHPSPLQYNWRHIRVLIRYYMFFLPCCKVTFHQSSYKWHVFIENFAASWGRRKLHHSKAQIRLRRRGVNQHLKIFQITLKFFNFFHIECFFEREVAGTVSTLTIFLLLQRRWILLKKQKRA